MTGTPTPQMATRNGLRNLLGLMKFLKHDDFAIEHGGDEVRRIQIRGKVSYVRVRWYAHVISYFMTVLPFLLILFVLAPAEI